MVWFWDEKCRPVVFFCIPPRKQKRENDFGGAVLVKFLIINQAVGLEIVIDNSSGTGAALFQRTAHLGPSS